MEGHWPPAATHTSIIHPQSYNYTNLTCFRFRLALYFIVIEVIEPSR